MAPTSTILRAARPAFRSSFFTSQSAHSQDFRSTFRSNFQSAGKRWQSTAGAASEAAAEGWLKRMWNSPIGIKTVHFWAPVMKWGLVVAGVNDLYRPAEKLSLQQNVALTCTGLIWTRWCFVIKPKNMLLASVNASLAVVGIIQITRILRYNASVKNLTPEQQLEAAKAGVVEVGEGLKEDVKEIVKS